MQTIGNFGVLFDPSTFPQLQRGSKGADVITLQEYLVDLKYLNAKNPSGSSAIDGDFGAGTEAAVKAFQSINGLTSNGIVNTATWNILLSGNAKINPGLPSVSPQSAAPVISKSVTTTPISAPIIEESILEKFQRFSANNRYLVMGGVLALGVLIAYLMNRKSNGESKTEKGTSVSGQKFVTNPCHGRSSIGRITPLMSGQKYFSRNPVKRVTNIDEKARKLLRAFTSKHGIKEVVQSYPDNHPDYGDVKTSDINDNEYIFGNRELSVYAPNGLLFHWTVNDYGGGWVYELDSVTDENGKEVE